MTLDQLAANVRGSLVDWATSAEADDFAPWVVSELRSIASEAHERILAASYMRGEARGKRGRGVDEAETA